MTSRLLAGLRERPLTIPALGGLTLFVVWAGSQAGSQAGYPVTHWAPGGLIVMGLLLVAVIAVPPRVRQIPKAMWIAIGCLAGYAAFSFLSILWAAVPSVAWEGANRTLLYLLVFSLFGAWPRDGTGAALLLVTWTVAMIGLAAFVALHLDGVSEASMRTLMPEGRLDYPVQALRCHRMSPFWIWMQVAIVVFVVIGIIVAATKLA